jgi:hypothetical protein
VLSVVFKKKDRALEYARIARKSRHGAPGILFDKIFDFWQSLAILDAPEDTTEEEKMIPAKTIAKYLDFWCQFGAKSTFYPLGVWLQAEVARSDKNILQAVELYVTAISESTSHSFIHYAAMLNERCADHLILHGRAKAAVGYLSDAHQCTSGITLRTCWHTKIWG